jgi:hypothetical protein
MRKLIIAALGMAAAATALPSAASAQYGRGYYNYNGRNQVAREIRECRRELRHADSRREYQRELRECRREIARAQRQGHRGGYNRGYRGYDQGYYGRNDRRGW